MKKRFDESGRRHRRRAAGLVFLVMMLSLASSAFAGAASGKPGDTVKVEFPLTRNPQQASLIQFRLQYDSTVLEPADSAIRNDGGFWDAAGALQPGAVKTVSFRILDDAPAGEYGILMTVVDAVTANYESAQGTWIEAVTLTVRSGKEQKENEYYANGKLKKEYSYNADGNLERVTYYNRYGGVTYYEKSEAWDQDGNILQETDVYPNSTGKYREYHYTYTYDERGNQTSWFYTYADGSQGYSGTAEYDGNDRMILRTGRDDTGALTYTDRDFAYNSDGKVIGYTSYDGNGAVAYSEKDYVYNSDGKVISYTRYKGNGKVDYYYNASYVNGIRVEYTETNAAGRVTSKYTYDPVMGDELSSAYEYDDKQYESSTTYYDTYYEKDWRSLSYNSRTVTRYDGPTNRELYEERYERENSSSKWVYKSRSTTTVLAYGATKTVTEYASGEVSERTEYQDGSSYYISKRSDGSYYESKTDTKGNTIHSKSVNADGSVSYEVTSEYDSNGLETRSNWWNADGSLDRYYLYEYDAQGNKTGETIVSLDEKGNTTSRSESTYGQNGKRNYRRIDYLKADGSLDYYYIYSYDENGEETSSIKYNANGKKSSETRYRRMSDGTRQSRWIMYNEDGSVRRDDGWK